METSRNNKGLYSYKPRRIRRVIQRSLYLIAFDFFSPKGVHVPIYPWYKMSFQEEFYFIPSSVPDPDDLTMDIYLALRDASEKKKESYVRSSLFDQFPKEVQDEIIKREKESSKDP